MPDSSSPKPRWSRMRSVVRRKSTMMTRPPTTVKADHGIINDPQAIPPTFPRSQLSNDHPGKPIESSSYNESFTALTTESTVTSLSKPRWSSGLVRRSSMTLRSTTSSATSLQSMETSVASANLAPLQPSVSHPDLDSKPAMPYPTINVKKIQDSKSDVKGTQLSRLASSPSQVAMSAQLEMIPPIAQNLVERTSTSPASQPINSFFAVSGSRYTQIARIYGRSREPPSQVRAIVPGSYTPPRSKASSTTSDEINSAASPTDVESQASSLSVSRPDSRFAPSPAELAEPEEPKKNRSALPLDEPIPFSDPSETIFYPNLVGAADLTYESMPVAFHDSSPPLQEIPDYSPVEPPPAIGSTDGHSHVDEFPEHEVMSLSISRPDEPDVAPLSIPFSDAPDTISNPNIVIPADLTSHSPPAFYDPSSPLQEIPAYSLAEPPPAIGSSTEGRSHLDELSEYETAGEPLLLPYVSGNASEHFQGSVAQAMHIVSPPRADLLSKELEIAQTPYIMSNHVQASDHDAYALKDESTNIPSHSDVLEDSKVEKLIAKLTEVFKDKKEYRKLLSCRGSSAQSLLDIFQRLLDIANDRSPSFQRNLIAAAQRLAEKSGLCPRCYDLDNISTSDTLEGSGGFADIYKGLLRGRSVCLKMIRLNTRMQAEHFLKVISKEAILWSQLRHPNVLPFYGVYRYKSMVSFVAPWMVNGDIQSFLKVHQDSDRVVLAFDVAQGLRFLHNNSIVHGDLKGPNILINEFERACIADFGLSSVSDKEILTWTSHSSMSSKGGTVRWQAPELFNPEEEEDIQNTNASDIYAWACVAYEIFAGYLPFAHLTRDAAVMNKVMTGQRPVRPLDSSPSWDVWGLTEKIWALMEVCWNSDPVSRPTVDVVIERLEASLPADVRKEVNDDSLSPAQFREMALRDVGVTELSVETLESLLATQ